MTEEFLNVGGGDNIPVEPTVEAPIEEEVVDDAAVLDEGIDAGPVAVEE